MYLSYNWLKEFVDFDLSIEELDHVLTMLGIEVEEVVDYAKKYNNFFTAKVISKEKHPDADKLSVCRVDYGKEEKTVVCGAPNVDAGQMVVLGVPGSVVPSAGFTIKSQRVRKVLSDGMICSEAELEVGDDGSGIWVLPENTAIGLPLIDHLKLNDIIFDVSLTPNKADCNSHIGVARELSAYLKNKVKIPEVNLNSSGNKVDGTFQVFIDDEDKCPRYTARIIKNVKVQESPEWLKTRLLMIGLRPMNVIVDVTNYVMMECGQPLHAFDLDKITGNKIICRTAKDKEKFTTLDGKERELDSSMLMICDKDKAIAIGGVMGGMNSEITSDTKDVLLESVFFDPSSIRKTAKKLGIQSDSSYRFERGVDIDNLKYASDRAAELIIDLAGGTIENELIDVYPNPKKKLILTLRYQRANDIIGINITPTIMKEMLEGLRFHLVSEDENSVTVEVPFSRVDVSLEIDLIEEIARLYNYDNIEADYSVSVNLSSDSVPDELAIPKLRKALSVYLIDRGFHELITQNMIDPISASIFSDKVVTISNPLGEELSIMRPSLVPSMLKTIERNIRLGSKDLRLFEIGKSFHLVGDEQKTFLKNYYEKEELIIALSGNTMPVQWGEAERKIDFFDIKGLVEDMIEFFRFKSMRLKPLKDKDVVLSKNSLSINYKKNLIGSFGEVSVDILKKFGIETPVFIAIINLSELYKIETNSAKYSPVPPYPAISRDIAFVVDKQITAGQIKREIDSNGGKLLKSVKIFDLYEGKSIGAGKKSIAFSLNFASNERTLTDDEIEKFVINIISSVEKKFDAQLRKF